MKRRKYESDELDSFDEIREAMNALRNEVVNEFEAQQEELNRLRDRVTKKKKKKGFVMKRTMLSIVMLSIVAGVLLTAASGAFVRNDITSEIAGNPDFLSEYLRNVVNSGNTYVFNPIAAPSGSNNIDEGAMYYDISANTFYGSKDGSTWTEFATGGATSLDAAYNVGSTIDVGGDAVTLTVSDTDDNVVLALVQNDSTNDNTAMTITSAANAANAISLDIDSQSTGRDIEGTGATWYVTGAGLATFTIGAQSTPLDRTANTTSQAGSLITAGTRIVEVTAVAGAATDFVVLPVGVLGERVTIIATVACELRTIAASNDEINEVDSDGTQEYQMTAGDIVDLICVEAGARWTAVSHTILGAAKTIVPD